MGQGSLELELKFVGAPAEVAALVESRLLRAVADGPGAWMTLRSRYFDSETGDLARDGVALRLREEQGRRVQAVKRATAAGAVVREEYETVLGAGDPFPAPTGDRDLDRQIEAAGPLVCIADLSVDRWRQPARFGGAALEIAVDLGRASGPGTGQGQARPIAELEIEFVDGKMAAVFEFARLVADNAPLRLSTRTKLEAARDFLGGEGPYGLGKQEKPVFDPAAPAADALQAMLAAVAVRVIEVQAPLIDIRAVEGVHQMRVALRRFRAIERTFRKALDGEALYGLTRPARDFDVFLNETMPDVFARGANASAGDIDALRAEIEARRAAAWADAHALVASKDFVRFSIDLLEAGVLAPWRGALNDRGLAPLDAFAPRALDRALKKARRAEAEMDRTELAARHPLRIALKKYRYTAQMLGQLYPKEKRKPYMAALSRLQEALGTVNDAVVAQQIAERAATGAGPGAMRAAGFLSGYKAAEAEAAAAEIDRAWEAFEEMTPFWHDG